MTLDEQQKGTIVSVLLHLPMTDLVSVPSIFRLWEDGMGYAQITITHAGLLTLLKSANLFCDGLTSGSSRTSWLEFCVAKEGKE